MAYSYPMPKKYPLRPPGNPPPPSGLYIAEWCGVRGMSIQQLADKVGVSYQTIWRYIESERQPTIEKLKPVTAALGLSDVADLTKPPNSADKNALLSGLTPDQKREVMQFIRFVRERDKT